MRFSANAVNRTATSDPVIALAEAQTLLLQSSNARLDTEIAAVLKMIAQAHDADRAFLFMIKDMMFVENTHQWVAQGIKPVQEDLKVTPYYAGAMFWDAFRRDGMLALADTSTVPAGSEMHNVLVQQDIKSMIAAPLWSADDISGFVGLDFCREAREFDACDCALIRSLAASLSAALKHRQQVRHQARLETDLQAALDRISSMVRALPELLLETDRHGVVVGFHQSPPLILALAPEEVIGRPPEQFLPPHVAAISRKAMAQVDASGWSETLSYSINIDGRAKRFALHATRRGASGSRRSQGYLFVVRDVTESYEQTHHLPLLGRMADLSSNLIMLTDERQRVTRMNPAAIARTGISLDAALGRDPVDLLRLDTSDSGAADDLRHKLKKFDQFKQDVAATSWTGLPYWIDLNMQSLTNAEGEVQGYMIVASDVSLHKLAEARALRERISTMDLSDDGIAITQPDGHIAYMNSTMRRVMCVSADTPIQTLTWHDINPQPLRDQFAKILPELYSQGQWNGEVAFPQQNAADRYFDMSIWVQSDGAFLTIAREITARKASEKNNALLREQLHIAQSRQQIAQLAGGLAHDIYNFMAVIMHTIEAMKQDLGHTNHESLARIESASAQVLSLLKNMSKLSRREAQRSVRDIRPIVKQSTDLLRPSLGGDAELTLTMPDDPINILCDQTELMQVLINLMINARDALPLGTCPRAQISVHVHRLEAPEDNFPLDVGTFSPEHRYTLLEVCDTGIGLSTELKKTMFDPYFSTKGKHGTGLGMSIVSAILLSNKAALRVQSEPGEGTRVQVFWPIASEASAPELVAAGVEETPSLVGLNVLLAGDNETALAEMSKLLSSAGAEVASCATPQEAIAAVRDDPGNWNVIVVKANTATPTVDAWAKSFRQAELSIPVILTAAEGSLHFATPSAQNENDIVLHRADAASVLETLSHYTKLRTTH